jgi:outer membrane protein
LAITRVLAVAVVAALLACPAVWAGPAPARELTIEEAVAIAVAGSPAVRGATAGAAAARSAWERAGAEEAVQVRFDSRLAWLSKVPTMQAAPGAPAVALGEHTTWSASLVASWTAWSGGRIPALLRQTDASARSLETLASRTLQTAAFAAERAFWLLVASQEEREVAIDTLAAAESHLGVATARFEAGAAARFDVIRAEVQVEESRQGVIQKEASLASARAGLLQALGRSEGDFIVVPPGIRSRPPIPLSDLIGLALVSRPEMEASSWQIEAASALIAAAEAERMPVVTVGADYQVVEPDSATHYDRLSVGAALSVPVLDGGRARARKGEALSTAAQVRASRDGLRLQIEYEVRQAWARIESAEAQTAVAGKRIEQADELLRLAGVRYQGGVGTATEVADAQASLAAGRFGLTRARAELGIAEAELRLAVGASPGAASLPEGGGR